MISSEVIYYKSPILITLATAAGVSGADSTGTTHKVTPDVQNWNASKSDGRVFPSVIIQTPQLTMYTVGSIVEFRQQHASLPPLGEGRIIQITGNDATVEIKLLTATIVSGWCNQTYREIKVENITEKQPTWVLPTHVGEYVPFIHDDRRYNGIILGITDGKVQLGRPELVRGSWPLGEQTLEVKRSQVPVIDYLLTNRLLNRVTTMPDLVVDGEVGALDVDGKGKTKYYHAIFKGLIGMNHARLQIDGEDWFVALTRLVPRRAQAATVETRGGTRYTSRPCERIHEGDT